MSKTLAKTKTPLLATDFHEFPTEDIGDFLSHFGLSLDDYVTRIEITPANMVDNTPFR